MASKVISIREDVYKMLQQLKEPNESFSEVIERLVKERIKNPLRHFGITKDLPDEINDEFENAILRARKEDAKSDAARFSKTWIENQ
jgi:predicted CopG family antitoxin